MKIVFAIYFALIFALGCFAQDKGTIPPSVKIDHSGDLHPGPMASDGVTIFQKISLKTHIKKFLKKVTAQKRICKHDKLALAETDFTDLYLNSFLADSPYLTSPPINTEKCGDEVKPVLKHHPDIACIFKDAKVQDSLKEILDHSAYFSIMSEHGKAGSLYIEMTEYYQKLLKDYDHKK